MSANVIQLERIFQRSCDWSTRELAEFYRVESSLIQAGLKIDTERGLSDEGDPWFAFCRPDDGEVVVHIARIGGIYILAGPAYAGVATGSDIAALVRDLVSRHPLIQMRGQTTGHSAKIFLHPAALLIAVVATAFFKSTEARALTDEQRPVGETRAAELAPRSENVSVAETHKTVVMDALQTAVILSAVASLLQSPSLSAAEANSISAIAATSDLLDFATLSSPVQQHPLNLLSGPAVVAAHPVETHQLEAHRFEAIHDVQANTVPLSIAPPQVPAQVGAADALPLIAVLWDVAVARPDTKAAVHDASNAATVSTNASPASVALQSPIVTFKMALASDSHDSLPVVQAAKITYTATAAPAAPAPQSAPETQVVAKTDLLPTALVSALKDAVHATIDGQPIAVSNASFASTLFKSLADHVDSTVTQGPTQTTTQTTTHATTPPTGNTTAVKPADQSPVLDIQ